MRRPSADLQIVPASPTANDAGPAPIRKKTIRKTKIKYGSDFCGMGTFSIALQELAAGLEDFDIEHVFCCDVKKTCRDVTNFVEKATHVDGDISTRDLSKFPKAMSMYSSTAPCQGLSPAGKGLGINDRRTKLVWKSVETIEELLPKAFIMENSNALAQFQKHKNFYDGLLRRLRKAGASVGLGYIVVVKVLNSRFYVPQNRSRTYIVGIRNDTLRHNAAKGIEVFPAPPSRPRFTLADVVVPLTTDFKMLPDDDKKAARVGKAVREAKVNAYLTPVVVDIGASDKFSTFRVAEVPTITRTRSSQKEGYWCTTKGGVLTAGELAACQGFSGSLVTSLKTDLGLSNGVIGACVGNAQTLPLLADIICHVLYMSKAITKEQFIAMKLNAEKMKPF